MSMILPLMALPTLVVLMARSLGAPDGSAVSPRLQRYAREARKHYQAEGAPDLSPAWAVARVKRGLHQR